MGSAKDAYLIVLCQIRLLNLTAEVTAEVYGGIHKTGNRTRKHKQLSQSDKTDSRTFVFPTHLLYNAFIVVTVWHIYPSFFHHL